MEKKIKVLEFANQVSRVKMGSKGGVTYDRPEYRILEPVVSNEMATVALGLKMREKQSAQEVATTVGMPLEYVTEKLFELADAGICLFVEKEGVDKFWYEPWVPGIMEMVCNNKANVDKYPQLAQAFDDYGTLRGPLLAGNFPMGISLMRVLPIESAVESESHRASYEEVSMYLNSSHKFSVSDCSCRTAREALGEGCGHLKEDMCIQLDDSAEYYIRSGRAKEITREEAFEIIKRAEANGLMHQIPNTDGIGHTHAICNCCGCSCLAMRNASMFLNPDAVRSNYVSKVDKDKCVACGECVEVCPVNALRLGQKVCSKDNTTVAPEWKDIPADTEWGKDKWNKEYRYNRQAVMETGTAPCKTNCPAHIAVQGYIKLASQGKYAEALELTKRENPFPAVCGRVCPRGCESECTRGDIDSPVAIDEIKKFIAEQDLHKDSRYIPKKMHDYSDKKIAIVGAGPSGMSCAFYLAIDGYDVTVFEKQPKLGGMLTLGIPSFRLEKAVLEAEIDILSEMGVKFKTGVEIGKDVTLDQLRTEGFDAFYIAIGAQAGRKLNIANEDAAGVISGVDFVRDINLGKDVKLTGNVVVIGGGNVAIDVARSATRVGETKVSMYCLESRETMPALPEEIEEALEENIVINNSYGPSEVVVTDGKVSGVIFKKCISVLDENGRFSPKFDDNDIITVPADTVLISVGQSIDWGNMLEGSTVELNPNNTIKVAEITYQSTHADIFAGGDSQTGPKFAIDAIAAGKQAAVSIHRFVHKGQSLTIGRTSRVYKSLDKDDVAVKGFDETPRQRPVVKHAVDRYDFSDVRQPFSEEQMKKETERCLGCGATVVDEYLCVGCGACTTRCSFGAISLVRAYNAEGARFEDMKPIVMKNMIKRKGKMAVKKVKNIFKG